MLASAKAGLEPSLVRSKKGNGTKFDSRAWRNFIGSAAFLSNFKTRGLGQTVFSWFKPNKEVQKDRKHLEARARRLLKAYLSADAPRKQQYYEVVAGAAAACEPNVSDPSLENVQLAQAAAEAAAKVVKQRERQAIADKDEVDGLITDAYATVAIAYRRASAAYTADEDMQQLGTAAVHLLTIATSYMAAQSSSEVAQM